MTPGDICYCFCVYAYVCVRERDSKNLSRVVEREREIKKNRKRRTDRQDRQREGGAERGRGNGRKGGRELTIFRRAVATVATKSQIAARYVFPFPPACMRPPGPIATLCLSHTHIPPPFLPVSLPVSPCLSPYLVICCEKMRGIFVVAFGLGVKGCSLVLSLSFSFSLVLSLC